MAPADIFWDWSIFYHHPQDIRYLLWSGGINVFDIYFGYLVLFLVASKKMKVRYENIFKLLLFTIINVLGLILLSVNGLDFTIFYDGILLFWRVCLFIIFSHVVCDSLDRKTVILVICSSCALLSVISIVAFLFFGFEGARGLRINYLGFGPNGSVDFAVLSLCLLSVIAKDVDHKFILAFLAFCILLYIPLAGSRRSLVYLALLLLLLSWRDAKVRYVVVLSCFFILIVAVFLQDFSSEVYEQISLIVRILETIESISLGELNDGRGGMYDTALSVILNYPLGLGNSDWAIQSKMQEIGVGSHTHNIILQLYLKLGIFGILMIFLLPRYPVIKCNPYFLLALFIIVTSNLTGHGYWNVKTLFIHIFLIFGVWRYGAKNEI